MHHHSRDLMTLTYKLDLDTTTMYLRTKTESFYMKAFKSYSKWTGQTHTHTHQMHRQTRWTAYQAAFMGGTTTAIGLGIPGQMPFMSPQKQCQTTEGSTDAVLSRDTSIIGWQSVSADYWPFCRLSVSADYYIGIGDRRFCIVWTTCHWNEAYVCIYVCHLLKHQSGFHFWEKWAHFVTLLFSAFLFCLHSAVLQVSKSPRITIGA